MIKRFKNKKIFLAAFLGLVLGSFLVVPVVFAIDTGIEYGTALGLGTQDLRVTVMEIVRIILGFLGVIAIILALYAGWVWMTSGGNEEKISRAKRILTNAAIGLAIILSSFMIVSFIISQLTDATGANPGDPGFSCTADQCYACGSRCNSTGDGVFPDPSCEVPALCDGGPGPSCGNGVCESALGETTATCPADCLPGIGDSCDTDPGPACGSGPCQPGLACDANAGCTCQDIPIIDYVSPGDGASQNFITIGGRNFGTTPGEIFFSDGFGQPTILAQLASSVNAACTQSWSDDQIIVVVPSGASDGPIRLVKPDGSVDETGDSNGPAIADFDVNNVVRPGLCDIDPNNGVTETPVVLEGANLNPSTNEVYFSSALAGGSPAGSNTQITGVRVPPLPAIQTSVTVFNNVSGQTSNPLNFKVNDIGTSPVIFSFSPGSGAQGTYVTILGANFGDSRGVNDHVYFVGATTVEADYNFPEECSGTIWSDNQIIVKVPQSITDGLYTLEIQTPDGSDDTSDLSPSLFDVNNIVRPNICRLIPDNGPVGQNMTIVGSNLNDPDVDEIIFFQSVSQTDLTLNAQSVDTKVASGAITGPVTVYNTLGQNSNGLNFNVGACSPNSCGGGQECCSAGIFSGSCMPQGQCAGAPEDSAYTWFFSTESFGPKVVETCNRSAACGQGAISSPTPYSREGTAAGGYLVGLHRLDDGAVPVDSIISGMIDSLINKSTLNPGTILVDKCNSAGDSFDSSTCNDPVALADLNVFDCNYQDFDNVDATCFDYEPTSVLDPNSWYRVTLVAPEIFALNGEELAGNDISGDNYSWVFKTRDSTELSQVSCVAVQPSNRTSHFIGEELPWVSQAYDQDFVCVNLNPSLACSGAVNSGWDWDTPNESPTSPRASILLEDKNTATSTSLLEAIDPLVDIVAYCSVPDGLVSGQGNLEIDLSSPYVIDKFPDCGKTCLNSSIGARFNLELNLGGPNGIDTALDLYNCYDQPNCDPSDANRANDFIDPDALSITEPDFTYVGRSTCYDYDGDGDPDYCLLPDSYYRVVIRDTVTSLETNKHLVGLNFDDPTHPDDPADANDELNAYSWIFKTQEVLGLCLPDQIVNQPAQAQVPIGTRLIYGANPLIDIPQCEGVRLDPYSFEWLWDVEPDGPADLLTTIGYQSAGGELRDACGNGVIEPGEDCDDGNIVSGDGCSGTDTPASCLNENDPDTGNSNYYDVCGNGVIELTEMCESPGSPGCSAECLLGGSVFGTSLCGDGIIGLGEECDDGELFGGGAVVGGDGCSTSCLVENAINPATGQSYRNEGYCRSNSSNIFDFSQDPNSCDSGYTAVVLNSAPGNSNSGPVCGNALIEVGEECDVGGTCSNDPTKYCTVGNLYNCGDPFNPAVTCVIADSVQTGCSAQCINTGSVLENEDPFNVGPYQIAFTLADGTTEVWSEVENFNFSQGGPRGIGELIVGNGGNNNGPTIIDKYPDCGTACINAEMGATFSRSMNTLFGGPYSIVNSNNISFYECGLDVNCNQVNAQQIDITLNTISEFQPNDSFVINLPPTYNRIEVNGVSHPALLPNTTYRVVVSGLVRSVGTADFPNPQSLAGLNYDDPSNGSNGFDSFSWTFRTQDTFDLCQIGSVQVLPGEKTLPQSTTQQYYSRPRSEPDSCDPENGQRLNPYFYSWDWSADGIVPISDSCGDGIVEDGEDCDDGNIVNGDGCSSICQVEGAADTTPNFFDAADLLTTAGYQDADGGSLRSLCGNLAVEFGEDCDDGNLIDDDGCSSLCQNEGTSACGPGGTNCCGNGIIEVGEDCDGDSIYCDATCQLTGNHNYYTIAQGSTITYASVGVCGDGVIDFNEQCDTGNEPNGDDTDGCTDICLISGSLPSTDAVCGDGQIGEGEECDDGQLTQYYCSDTYNLCDPSSPTACGNQPQRCVNIPKGGDGCTGFVIDIDGEIVQEICEQQDFTDISDNYYAMCHWTGNSCQTRPCLFEDRVNTLVCRSNVDNSFDFNQDPAACTTGYQAVPLGGVPACWSDVNQEINLNQNPNSCGTGYTQVAWKAITGNNNWGLPVCGNGTVEDGEECDIGPGSIGDDTDGCSDMCTNIGQALNLQTPAYIGPFQVVETLAQFLPVTSLLEAQEEIKAWATSRLEVVGVSDLTVVASSRIPFVVMGHQPYPDDEDMCRNVALEIAFSRPLDVSTIAGNISLCEGAACNGGNNIIETTSYRRIYGTCEANTCNFKRADLDNTPLAGSLCQIDSDCIGSLVEVTSITGGFLDANTEYFFEVDDLNLKEESLTDEPARSLGSTCSDDSTTCNWSFTTGADFCQCDHVNVEIINSSGGAPTNKDVFTCAGDSCGGNTASPFDDDANSSIAGNQHEYIASCYDVNNPQGQVIKLAPGGIEYSWAEFDIDSLIYLSEVTSATVSGCDTDSSCLVTPGNDNDIGEPPVDGGVVTPGGRNGESEVYVGSYQYRCSSNQNVSCIPGVTVCPGTGNCELTQTAHATVDVTNFICNNPWPNHPNVPFNDQDDASCLGDCPDTNFKFMYCQDDGDNNTVLDDIPSLVEPGDRGVSPTKNGTNILKDLFFPVCSGQEECEGSDATSDAIAFRVLQNPMRLSPETYYQTGFCGGQADLDNICYSNNDCSSVEIFKPGDWNGDVTLSDPFNLPSGSYTYSVDARSFDRVSITARTSGNDLCSNPTCEFNGELGKVCGNGTGDWERLTCTFTLDQNTEIYFANALQVSGSADFANPSLEAASCQFNVPNPGSPQSLVVDGYEAVRDGRSVYVAASNEANPTLYTNIYLLSYNESASNGVAQIFERIIDQSQESGLWAFNTNIDNHRICESIGLYQGTDNICTSIGSSNFGDCFDKDQVDCNASEESLGCYWNSSASRCMAHTCVPIYCESNLDCPNLDCNAQKESIIRDVKRYADLVDIQLGLKSYFETNNTYPNLTGGSYIASTTFSVWPSWQQTLASSLQTGLSVDPINEFIGCSPYFCDEGELDGIIQNNETTACTLGVVTDCGGKPQHCLPLDPDAEQTCWDEQTQTFSCPVPDGLHAYAYRSAQDGNTYELYTTFENDYWITPGVTYTLPLANTVGSCDLLNFELNKTGVTNNPSASQVCTQKRCYGGSANPATDSCNTNADCSVYGPTSYCTGDADFDGVCDLGFTDNCSPIVHCPDDPQACYNPDQKDSNSNSIGDVCDSTCTGDADADGICDIQDSCPFTYNPGDYDFDGDGIKNACDPCTDMDFDGWGDVITPGTDLSICKTDNVPKYSCSLNRSIGCQAVGVACSGGNGSCSATPTTADKFGYCANDKLTSCSVIGSTCPDGKGQCLDMATYNPYQEDFDNDKIGYIADLCIDFDKDGFGDWTFYTGPGTADVRPVVLTPNQQEHFRGCQGTGSFQGFTSTGSLSDLDNCPGGPNGATCRDAFGIGISCYNPAPESGSWEDISGVTHSNGQEDYLLNNKGYVCNDYNYRCGDGIVDVSRGEVCDCGDASTFASLKDPFTGEYQPAGSFVCITPNGTLCSDIYHNGPDAPNPPECYSCSSCQVVIEEQRPYCGDGEIQGGEICDEGPDNGDCIPGAYGETCVFCDACQGYVEKPASYCGDGIYDDPAVQPGSPEECDCGSDGITNCNICSQIVGNTGGPVCDFLPLGEPNWCSFSCIKHIQGEEGGPCPCLDGLFCVDNICRDFQCDATHPCPDSTSSCVDGLCVPALKAGDPFKIMACGGANTGGYGNKFIDIEYDYSFWFVLKANFLEVRSGAGTEFSFVSPSGLGTGDESTCRSGLIPVANGDPITTDSCMSLQVAGQILGRHTGIGPNFLNIDGADHVDANNPRLWNIHRYLGSGAVSYNDIVHFREAWSVTSGGSPDLDYWTTKWDDPDITGISMIGDADAGVPGCRETFVICAPDDPNCADHCPLFNGCPGDTGGFCGDGIHDLNPSSGEQCDCGVAGNESCDGGARGNGEECIGVGCSWCNTSCEIEIKGEEGSSCINDSSCLSGLICEDNICREGCRDDGDCVDPLVCNLDTFVCDPGVCETALDCPNPEDGCVEGYCNAGCFQHSDCRSGYACEDNACTPVLTEGSKFTLKSKSQGYFLKEYEHSLAFGTAYFLRAYSAAGANPQVLEFNIPFIGSFDGHNQTCQLGTALGSSGLVVSNSSCLSIITNSNDGISRHIVFDDDGGDYDGSGNPDDVELSRGSPVVETINWIIDNVSDSSNYIKYGQEVTIRAANDVDLDGTCSVFNWFCGDRNDQFDYWFVRPEGDGWPFENPAGVIHRRSNPSSNDYRFIICREDGNCNP